MVNVLLALNNKYFVGYGLFFVVVLFYFLLFSSFLSRYA